MAKKINDSSFKISRPISRIWNHKVQSGDYDDGSVITSDGIVHIYAQGGGDDRHTSRLDFAWQGRLYSRDFQQRLTTRGLVTAATRFAREIVEGVGHG